MEFILYSIIVPVVSIAIAIISLFLAFKRNKFAKKQLELAEEARERNQQLNELFGEEDELLQNVTEVLDKAKEILKIEAKNGKISVRNYGLDLETVVPWLRTWMLPYPKFSDIEIQYQGLIINPDSEHLIDLIDGESDLSKKTVESRLIEIQRLEWMKFQKIDIEIRSYDAPPVIHGFIINERHLFLSFTEIVNHKIRGGLFPYTYMEFDKDSHLNCHYFNMFNTWFDHIWSQSPEKYKIKK